MIHSSTSEKVDVLRAIWKRLLHRTSITAEDNFFELGGAPSSAEELFAEIASLYGRELSPVLIYQAPTIASLAALLSQNEPVHVPPLLLLNSGTQSPPIFMAHGLGSTVMGLFELVKHMRAVQPIYGMQARGVEGLATPFDRVEDMAEYHLEAIQALQPRGPYFFIGYSLGGLVTLEVARRLSQKGEKIGLLAMLDSYPDQRYVSLRQRVPLAWRMAKRRLSDLIREERRPHDRVAPSRPRSEGLIPRAMQRVKDQQYRALRSYRPRFYDGKVKFLKSAVPTYFPEDAVAVWAHLSREFEVETVPGDHLAMLTTHVEAVACRIAAYLKEALSES